MTESSSSSRSAADADVRDELTRTETMLSKLRDENAMLERQLMRHTSQRKWILAGVIMSVLTVTAGYFVGDTMMTREETRRREWDAKDHADRIALERQLNAMCKANMAASEEALVVCQRTRMQGHDPSPPRPPPRPCRCQPGDPLCSCL